MASPFEANTCHSRDQAKWDEIHQENTRPSLPSLEPPPSLSSRLSDAGCTELRAEQSFQVAPGFPRHLGPTRHPCTLGTRQCVTSDQGLFALLLSQALE